MSKISPHFTIEDIHKIRIENHKENQNLSDDEIIAKTKDNALKIINRLNNLKESETNTVSKNSYPNVIEEQMAVCEDDKN